MKRLKRFLRNNRWAIMALMGILTWMGIFFWMFYGTLITLSFYAAKL